MDPNSTGWHVFIVAAFPQIITKKIHEAVGKGKSQWDWKPAIAAFKKKIKKSNEII